MNVQRRNTEARNLSSYNTSLSKYSLSVTKKETESYTLYAAMEIQPCHGCSVPLYAFSTTSSRVKSGLLIRVSNKDTVNLIDLFPSKYDNVRT
jgi:hypothetical protein